MAVVSVDLAYRHYHDIGIAILRSEQDTIRCKFIQPGQLGLSGTPAPEVLVEALTKICSANASRLILIDGPQAWKDPHNGIENSRLCERALNTPAKTGLPGHVKPANYGPFVTFSVALFDQLAHRGWTRLDNRALLDVRPYHLALESFPSSAWSALGIPRLPAKAKASASDIKDRVLELKRRFPLQLASEPNHDELQALVAGLAGIGLELEDMGRYTVVGANPRLVEGICREGFIINPRCEPTQQVDNV
jgi:hypothetical protein